MKKLRVTRNKILKGVAVNDSRDKTVLVEVQLLKINPLYQQRYYSPQKYLVHAKNQVKKGESVVIEECRPISKNKSWRIHEAKK